MGARHLGVPAWATHFRLQSIVPVRQGAASAEPRLMAADRADCVEALGGELSSPPARGVDTHSEFDGDRGVGRPGRSGEHDRARSRSRYSVRPLRARAVNTASSAAVSTMTNGLVTGTPGLSTPTTISATATRRDHP